MYQLTRRCLRTNILAVLVCALFSLAASSGHRIAEESVQEVESAESQLVESRRQASTAAKRKLDSKPPRRIADGQSADRLSIAVGFAGKSERDRLNGRGLYLLH